MQNRIKDGRVGTHLSDVLAYQYYVVGMSQPRLSRLHSLDQTTIRKHLNNSQDAGLLELTQLLESSPIQAMAAFLRSIPDYLAESK